MFGELVQRQLHSASRGPSALAQLLVILIMKLCSGTTTRIAHRHDYTYSAVDAESD